MPDLIIGIGKGKPMPPPKPPKDAGKGIQPPPKVAPEEQQEVQDEQGGQKASQADALYISADLANAIGGLSEYVVCGKCAYFNGNGCERVDGNVEEDGRCWRFFEPGGQHEEPEPEEQGPQGPPQPPIEG